MPKWFTQWEDIGLVAWRDKNGDNRIQYGEGEALIPSKPDFLETRGPTRLKEVWLGWD